MPHLGNFRPLVCGTLHTQTAMARWLGRRAPNPTATDLYRRLAAGGSIASRRTCVRDFETDDPAAMQLFKPDPMLPGRWREPTLEARMQVYSDIVRSLARTAFPPGEAAPRGIIQVSCTGYEAPSAVQRLCAERGWTRDTPLLSLGHMGCHAALPATRAAARLAQDEGGTLSLLFAELCTLHMRLDAEEPHQIVAQHLFADGAIRLDCAATPFPRGFALLGSFERLLAGSSEDMTWTLSGTGFRLALARRVPAVIARELPGLVADFLAEQGLHRDAITCYAIHPGGTRIIQGVATALEIAGEGPIRHSLALLRSRGNMSSATLPHVWSEILDDAAVPDGALVLSLAFGPGLTVAGNLMRKHGAGA